MLNLRIRKEFEKYRLFFIDLDGVIWRGNKAIEGAVETVNYLMEENRHVIFLTNNSTRSREEYFEKLRRLGVNAKMDNIITSSYACAIFLKKLFKTARVYVIGEAGLISELAKEGHVILSEDPISSLDAVVVGLDRELHYNKLAKAMKAIKNGALFIATNTDPTVPLETGFIPGAGSIVASLEVACNKKPDYIIGKPSKIIFEVALNTLKEKEIKKEEMVMIGDRLETDIIGAKNFGIDSILVLTGATKACDLDNVTMKPNYVLKSIRNLLE